MRNGSIRIEQETHPKVVVIISANAEWDVVLECFPGQDCQPSPYGQWLQVRFPSAYGAEQTMRSSQTTQPSTTAIFLHGGWGKIAAAGSTQYAIDRWQPRLLVNLGTCGGFAGQVKRGEIILAEKTQVYDIFEQMGDPIEAIAYYTTEIDLSWLREPYPQPVRRSLLVSADHDLLPADLLILRSQYAAVAGDWESGAIAYVAARNRIPTLILRGVTDLVTDEGGEAYGNIDLFHQASREIMRGLIAALPAWLRAADF